MKLLNICYNVIENRGACMKFIELHDVYKIYKNGVTAIANMNLKIKIIYLKFGI